MSDSRLRKARLIAATLVKSTMGDIRSLFARPPTSQDPRAQQLWRDGYVIIENYVDPGRADELRAEVEVFLDTLDPQSGEQKEGYRELQLNAGPIVHFRASHDGHREYDTGMIDVYHVTRAVNQLSLVADDPEITQIIDDASSMSFKVLNTNAYVNRGVVNPAAFHCDSILGTTDQFKSFLYLTDVEDEDDGPYCYVRRTHRFSPYRQFNLIWNVMRGYPPKDMRWYSKRKVIKFIAKRGTLIITNQNGFHRGWPQAPDRERILAVNNYVTLDYPSV